MFLMTLGVRHILALVITDLIPDFKICAYCISYALKRTYIYDIYYNRWFMRVNF